MTDLKITQDLIIIDGAAHNPQDVLEAAKTWVRLFDSATRPSNATMAAIEAAMIGVGYEKA